VTYSGDLLSISTQNPGQKMTKQLVFF